MSRHLRVLVLSAAVAAGSLTVSPSAHAAPETRCWLTCTTTPTTAPTPAPLPTYVQPAPAAPTPAPVATEPVVMVTKPPRPQLTGGEVAELLSLINGHRRSKGIRPVALDGALSEVARHHTAWMIAKNLLHHNDSLFTREMHQRLGIKLFAENVGYGSGVRDNHDGFLNSLHHRENMEGAAYTLVGLAVGRSSDGRIWVTENFGTPRIGGTTTVSAPRPAAPRPAAVSAPVRSTTQTVVRRAAASAAPAPAAGRKAAAAPALAQLVPAAPAPRSDDAAVTTQAAPPAQASIIEFQERSDARSRTAPIGAGVAAALATFALVAVAPRRRQPVAVEAETSEAMPIEV